MGAVMSRLSARVPVPCPAACRSAWRLAHGSLLTQARVEDLNSSGVIKDLLSIYVYSNDVIDSV